MPSARTKRKLKGTLFDKTRFEWMEKERGEELKKLNFSQASQIQADLLMFCESLRKNFEIDKPVSYKILLETRK